MKTKSNVKSYENLVRDEKTRAVLNTDRNGLLLYKQQRNKNREIDDLKNEVQDLKNMIANIMDKLDKWVHKYIESKVRITNGISSWLANS